MTENTILLTYHKEATKTGGQKSIALYQVEKLIVLRVTIICDISLFEIILSCSNHRKQLQNKTGI